MRSPPRWPGPADRPAPGRRPGCLAGALVELRQAGAPRRPRFWTIWAAGAAGRCRAARSSRIIRCGWPGCGGSRLSYKTETAPQHTSARCAQSASKPPPHSIGRLATARPDSVYPVLALDPVSSRPTIQVDANAAISSSPVAPASYAEPPCCVSQPRRRPVGWPPGGRLDRRAGQWAADPALECLRQLWRISPGQPALDRAGWFVWKSFPTPGGSSACA